MPYALNTLRLDYSIDPWSIWPVIESDLYAYCNANWFGSAADMVSAAKIKFYELWEAGKFKYFSKKLTLLYAIAIAHKIARNVVDYARIAREVSLDQLIDAGMQFPCDTPDKLDEKIETILRLASPQVCQCIELVLAGKTIDAACAIVGTTYSKLMTATRNLAKPLAD